MRSTRTAVPASVVVRRPTNRRTCPTCTSTGLDAAWPRLTKPCCGFAGWCISSKTVSPIAKRAECARSTVCASAKVLLTPSPCYIDDAEYRGGFSKADIAELLESLEQNYLGWSKAMAPVIMGTPDRPELQDELAESFCRTDPAHARVFARTTFLSDNRDDLALIPVPTLVIECAQDAIAPREVGAYVHAHIPDSQLVTLDAIGHCPQVSAPDATALAIAAFARST